MFMFLYLLEEVTSREVTFEFSSKFEIVECGIQIWKDESERRNTGGTGEEEDVGNNQQDTYEFSKTSN